ncbi:DUF4296 domain-containing protein [Paracrocinitomix mangrovi]|uniref:DUF4296 domain-containing protein n=1 Tax=Paracrocinitomix mangrovi TaxID=2862509 RepID=UPI001C8DCEFA|nr:DUF4296 domain-containing protein [Paracrocinitomix mangrovi]UKN00404.1 DUF4296 domain-containing protein [Paracrocinitomix mangrovi]
MKKQSLIILSSLMLACGSGESTNVPIQRPDNLLPLDQIIPVIIDLQILESHYQRMYQRPNMYKEALDSASTFVFEDHQISSEQFRSSYEYYACDVPTLFFIYETALDSVNTRVTLRQQQNNPQ